MNILPKDPNIRDELVWTTGEFFRMGSKKYYLLLKDCQPIDVKAGSLICFDNRLAHMTCDFLSGFDTREVIYMSFIPNIELNKKYCVEQMKHIEKNIYPPMSFDSKNPSNNCGDRNWGFEDLND